jgi:hypothetical protein
LSNSSAKFFSGSNFTTIVMLYVIKKIYFN